MFEIFSRIYDRQISSKGLAVFRIIFFLNLFLEVFQRFQYRHLYYDYIPYLDVSILSHGIIWYLWLCMLIMLVLGFKTRLLAIFNYIFIFAFIMKNGVFEYHMDYAYAGIGFLMIFLPISKSYSIDNLILRIKYSSKNKLFVPRELTSKFYYYLTILVGVGFVYFDSVFFKFKSLGWSSGLGMWLPASLPQITISSSQWLLNQEVLIKFLGYLTFAFELFFPFVFWIKKIRWPLFIIGIGLHLGILIEFPIPYFAVGVLAIYLVLVPVYFWHFLENKLSFRKCQLTFFYDEECPLCLRTKIIITFFDIFKAIEFKGVQSFGSTEEELSVYTEDELLDNIYSIDNKGDVRSGVDTYFKVFQYIPFFYVFMLFRLPLMYQMSKKIYAYIAKNRTVERCTFDNCVMPGAINTYIDIDNLKVLKNIYVKDLIKSGFFILFWVLVLFQINSTFNFEFIKSTSAKFRNISHDFLGITSHGVFIDGHFKEFKKVYALKYKGVFLPIINKNGMPDVYLKGGLWVNHNWRVNGPGVDVKDEHSVLRLEKGLGRFVAYWAYQEKVIDPVFEIVEKEIRVPYKWENNLLTNNINSPWIYKGKAYYDSMKGKLSFELLVKKE